MAALNPRGRYCMYLRRSRADLDEERRGAGETLARHYGMLMELAARYGIVIPESAIYREIVSGDTIAERSEVQRLLHDVENNMWDGVFVTEMSRLARGDTLDQGIVQNTFLYSNTQIITPQRIYNLRDQSDENVAEMDLFMARYEYKTIKRRLQAGRLNSVKSGLYCGSRDIYGYERYKLPAQRGYSLRIVPEKAAVVRMVFDWYVNGMDGKDVGCKVIAGRLNDMGFRTDYGKLWDETRIMSMLRNPTYCGKVWWNKKVQVVRMEDGAKVKKRVRSTPEIVDGVHEPIISEELFHSAERIREQHRKSPNPTANRGVANIFSGLMKCGVCGHAMILNSAGRDPSRVLLRCSGVGCPTTSSRVIDAEAAVLDALNGWVIQFSAAPDPSAPAQDDNVSVLIAAAEKQIATLEKQLSRLRDLLEQDVYTPEVYLQRQSEIQSRIAAEQDKIQSVRAASTTSFEDAIRMQLPQIKTMLELYAHADTPAEKNTLLKSVVGRIIYHKITPNVSRKTTSNDFSLEIYPLLLD